MNIARRLLLLALCSLGPVVVLGAVDDPAVTARVSALLKRTPLIDGHNDVMRYYLQKNDVIPALSLLDLEKDSTKRKQTSLPLWRQGAVGAQLLNGGWLGNDVSLAGTTKGSAFLDQLVAKHAASVARARTVADIRRIHAEGKLALVWSLEHPLRLGDSPQTVRALAQLGLRANIIAYNQASPLADGAYGPPLHNGLSPLGRTIVTAMEACGMLVDLSHSSEKTALDVLALARAPVIFSHSSARALCADDRNVSDNILRRLPANGGLVMVSFVPQFTREDFRAWMTAGDTYWEDAQKQHPGDKAAVTALMEKWEAAHRRPVVPLAAVADHIEHVRRVAGIDHVGLGSDFEGTDYTVEGLEDASKFPALLAELARRGWTDEELAKVAGENFLRVLGAAERATEP